VRSLVQKLGWILLLVAAACGVALFLSGLGTRLEWFHFRTGLTIFRWSATIALINAAICLIVVLLGWRQPIGFVLWQRCSPPS
jgi:hypothetical protein